MVRAGFTLHGAAGLSDWKDETFSTEILVKEYFVPKLGFVWSFTVAGLVEETPAVGGHGVKPLGDFRVFLKNGHFNAI